MFRPEAYFFSFYAIPSIIVSSIIFATGLFVFLQNRRNSSNIFFFLFCLSLNFWLYGRAIMYCSRNAEVALVWAKVFAKWGVVNIAPLVYAFSVHWLGYYREQKKYVIAGFWMAAAFYLTILFTPYGLTGVRHYFWGYYPVYGPVCKLFLVFFFTYFLAAFRNFFLAWKTATDPVHHKQIRVVTIAYLISFTGSVDFLPKIMDLSFYPFGYFCVFIWTLILAYAIVRYRTMDIQTVIHKTIMWFVTSAVFGAPLVLIFYETRDWLLRLNSGAFLVVASATLVLFTLYYRHIQPRIDHLFQRRKWDLTRTLEKFTDELVRLRGLEELSLHILKTVEETIYASNVSLVMRKEGGLLEIMRSKGPMASRTEKESGGPFLEWIEANDMIVSEKYISIDPRLAEVYPAAENYFKSMEATLSIPLIVDRKLLGVLNIGDKKNLQSFHADEISFLSDFRRSAAIALANTFHLIAMQENLRKWNEELERKVEERTRELNTTQAQLVQAEKLATIGTLAGGIAHEINNPLTAVLTNAQILKMTAVDPDDVESLSLIEEGAKRCQAIIQKLMKYSRKPMMGGEVLGSVDVHKVVDNTIAFLKYQLQQENIEVKLEKSENMVSVEGNSNELEQVLTNLILNSKDAIRQSGRTGEIKIKTSQQNGSVKLMVTDNGMGIPKENLTKIFDPFFTTKELGKGTGLGLAVTYGIIEKHKGRIEVASIPGQGTAFTITLPRVET